MRGSRNSVAEFEAWTGIVPIALREDVVARSHGLPSNLTEQEARKIAAVVMAYAHTPEER